jgi:uncharacterized protein DUF5670
MGTAAGEIKPSMSFPRGASHGAHPSQSWNQKEPTGIQARRLQVAWQGESKMLWTIFVVLLVLWFLGLVTSYTMGGFIHILLVLAVVTLLIRLIQGRKVIS